VTVSPQQGNSESQDRGVHTLPPENPENEVEADLWIRDIDDANRRAYSFLGAVSLIVSALLGGVLFYPDLSLYTVIAFLLLCPIVLIIGRFTILRRYEANLRQKAQEIALGNGTDLTALVTQLHESKRHIFFLKLFSGETMGEANRQNHIEEGHKDV
jgi:hypothetical protein